MVELKSYHRFRLYFLFTNSTDSTGAMCFGRHGSLPNREIARVCYLTAGLAVWLPGTGIDGGGGADPGLSSPAVQTSGELSTSGSGELSTSVSSGRISGSSDSSPLMVPYGNKSFTANLRNSCSIILVGVGGRV